MARFGFLRVVCMFDVASVMVMLGLGDVGKF